MLEVELEEIRWHHLFLGQRLHHDKIFALEILNENVFRIKISGRTYQATASQVELRNRLLLIDMIDHRISNL